MRYACDDLNAFDLHDARMLETALEGRDLLWALKDGNALPQCPVNPHGRAMRVPKLLLRLREYAVLHMEVWNVERRDPNSGMRQLLPQGLPPEVWQDALLGAGEVLSAAAREEAGALLVELGFFGAASPIRKLRSPAPACCWNGTPFPGWRGLRNAARPQATTKTTGGHALHRA